MDKKFLLIFVILVLIPVTILSYFGFKIIYYQEELEKRRVYNEQKKLASQIHESFRQQIITKYRYFSGLIEEKEINFSSLKRATLENRKKGIKLIFFMDTTGQFIFPNYANFRVSDISYSLFFDNRFKPFIERAKEFERKGIYELAISEYQKIIKKNKDFSSPYLSHLKYKIAKLYFKLGKFKKTISISREISSQYPYLLNQEGIPFFFLSSLLMGRSYLKMNQPDEALVVISRPIDSFMNGELILTNTCSILLKETIVTLRKMNAPESLFQKIDFLLDQISFGEMFSSKLEKALSKYLISRSREVEFLISDPNEPQALLLYYPLERENLKGILGFEYDLEQIIGGLLNNIKSEDLFVEIGQENRNFKNKLLHSEILSPLSPQFKIFISLKSKTFYRLQRLKTYLIAAIVFFLFTSLIFGMLIIVRDISRKIELSRLRSEFISNVTHELKAPLSSIRLYVETLILNRIKGKNKKREYLEIIMNESQRLSRLINNVLDFSKIETGQKDYHFKEKDISVLIRDVVRLFDYELKKEKFKLKLNFPKNPVLVSIDQDAISQVIINLISNAIKFSKERKAISISLRKEKKWIEIEIEDKGIGIPDKDLPYIFDKFYRVKNKETEGKTGAGIGLSLVKHIVEVHSGKIRVQSEVGKGTKFIVYLPI